MKTQVASALLAYAAAIPDETSLMQDMVKRSSSHTMEVQSTRQDTTSKLLDTAVAMMKNGVTPDVLEFVDATTADTQEVFQIILREHRRERDYVAGVCQRFTDAINTLDNSNEEIEELGTRRAGASRAHQECRADEALRCGNSRRCEAQLTLDWEAVVREEAEMKQKHDNIERGWCVEGENDHGVVNGWQHWSAWLNRPFDSSFWAETSPYPLLDIPAAVSAFRATSVTHFQEYMTQKAAVWDAWQVYNDKAEECADLESYWEAVIPDCDGAQQTAHQQACEHAEAIDSARTIIGATWRTVTDDLEHEMENRLNLEQARKNEWETLSIVQCLLDHIHSAVVNSIDTGAPCPTLTSDPEGVRSRIEECHTIDNVTCVEVPDDQLDALGVAAVRSSTHLCITPCDVPPPPEPPAIEAPPCTPAYIAKEQTQFELAIRQTYQQSLSSSLMVQGGDDQYGPYADEQVVDYGLSPWAADQWPGCAPPLACVDCTGDALEAFRPLEPLEEGAYSHYECRLHEEYLSAGQSNVNTFRCNDGRCLDQRGRCNNNNECGDASDEDNCESSPDYQPLSAVSAVQAAAVWAQYMSSSFTCPDDFHSDVHYRCGNSDQCIEKVGLCNGVPNCADGSDEGACTGSLSVSVETTSGRGAEVISSLETGATVFSDRGYTFDSLGDMAGKTFIRYSNDDKMIKQDHVMTKVRTDAPVRVYIAATSSHVLPWILSQHWSESSRQGPSFSGVKMTRHKEWKLDHEQGLHATLWGEGEHSHTPLETAHWADATTGHAADEFVTQHVYYKDFPAGTISISGNAASTHYDGSLSDTLDAVADGSFLIFLERFESFGETLLSSGQPQRAIQNGNFEQLTISGQFAPNYQYTNDVTGWAATGMTVVCRSGNAAWGGVSSEGNYYLALQASGASITQDLAGHIPGHSYTLRVSAAQRPGNNAVLRITANGAELVNEVIQSVTFEQREFTYTADAAVVTIRLENNVAGGDQTIFVDAVSEGEETLLSQPQAIQWEMIAHQDVSLGGYFPHSISTSFTHNADDPTAPLFMSIGNLASQDYLVDGRYHFRLEYTDVQRQSTSCEGGSTPEAGSTQEAEWTQTSWFTDRATSGFEPISPSNLGQTAGVSLGCQFNGLHRSSSSNAAIDGSADHGHWYHAVGSTAQWNNGIPAFRGADAQTMTLWVARAQVSALSSGRLRLVDGTASSGRLEIYHSGQWGTICDDGFSGYGGPDLACHLLGYPRGAIRSYTHRGGTGQIWLDDLLCTRNAPDATSLRECTSLDWGRHNCGHNEDVGVECNPNRTPEPPAVEGLVRLAAERLVGLAAGHTAGRLEIYHDGRWGTICDDGFGGNGGMEMACSALGYGRAVRSYTHGGGTGQIWLDNVMCYRQGGTPNTLRECTNQHWGTHNCAHSEDVGVECADLQ